MAKRQKSSFGSGPKVKRSYDLPGYSQGDIDTIKSVFSMNAEDGSTMSFDSLLQSKYLRFWPGRTADAEDIWCKVTGGSTDHPLTLDHLPEFLHRLDSVASATVYEMERERVSWEMEELQYEFLDKYFESAAKKRKLAYSDFLAWENIQAEMWYNEKGLSENKIAQIWEQITGCVSKSADKDTFVKIYNAVCGCQYQL
jgi:hypothetical protein